MPTDPHNLDAALEPEELDAVGAALEGYRAGAFLMAGSGSGGGLGPARWYEADPRAILPLTPEEGFHVPRRLARTVRQGRFEITADAAFEEVVEGCADPSREGRWINAEIVGLFALLHRAGLAHSIEAWTRPAPERRLVAGLYGLAFGGVFCAEAMFSRPDLGGRDASKVCLVHLAAHLRRCGFGVCDVQLTNPHLEQFGVRAIPRDEYLALLARWRDQDVRWGPLATSGGDGG